MVKRIKQLLYFPIANYFRFWAQIQLLIWKPTIIVVTGSSGKTTLLHLIEAQIGNKAKYSHHANSSYGIPFNILGLSRKDLIPQEWFYLFFMAPFKAFKKPPKERLYVVEADCDRPEEGKFLASLLRPEITLWISSSITHSVNFDCLVKNKSSTFSSRSIDSRGKPRGFQKVLDKHFASAEEAIAYEFGYFLEFTRKIAIINGNSGLIKKQLTRTNTPIIPIFQISLKSYKIFKDRTEFVIDNQKYFINFLVPKEIFYSIEMTKLLLKTLDISFDPNFSNLTLPPGRNSIFNGIKNTTIIDSTYNATPDGVRSILDMFNKMPGENKWLVLGDMIELGNEEKEEHEKIGWIILKMDLEKIILVGPRVSKYIPPILPISQIPQTFLMPKEALDYLTQNIKGGETILFKGARFLEGIIEHLLQNKKDIDKLVRREKIWMERRKKWGL